MTFETWLQDLHATIPIPSAHAVLKLTEEGGTVPFIARYRKEQTGNLDEVAIQQVIDAKERWDEILKRQSFIVEEIERQGKLTDELKDKILATFNLDSLEDLYLPYKQKRKTKATIAKEAGLEPLADWIWNIGHGSASANFASAEALLYMKTADGLIRKKLNELYSRIFTLAVRLYGVDCYVEFAYEDIDLRPKNEVEAFKAMKQSRVLELLSLGFMSDEEASIMLTGKLPSANAPQLSGTGFRANTSVSPAGSGYNGATNSGSTTNQNLNPDTPTGGARGGNKKADGSVADIIRFG